MLEVPDIIKTCLLDAGLRADIAQKPSNGGWTGVVGQSPFHSYGVIWPLFSPTDGSLNCPDGQWDDRIQVTAVSNTANGALTYAGRVVDAVRGLNIGTGDRTSMRPVYLKEKASVEPDDTADMGRVFFVPVIFGVPTASES